MNHQAGVRVAQVGFLFIMIAGVWLVAQIPAFGFATHRTIVAGVVLALGGLLPIIANYSGEYG